MKRVKNYEFEPDESPVDTVGSFVSWTEITDKEKPVPPKRQIGFIRQDLTKKKPRAKKR